MTRQRSRASRSNSAASAGAVISTKWDSFGGRFTRLCPISDDAGRITQSRVMGLVSAVVAICSVGIIYSFRGNKRINRISLIFTLHNSASFLRILHRVSLNLNGVYVLENLKAVHRSSRLFCGGAITLRPRSNTRSFCELAHARCDLCLAQFWFLIQWWMTERPCKMWCSYWCQKHVKYIYRNRMSTADVDRQL